MDLVIVSGMSGGGKTIALKMLEDIGYYCVDNIPPTLIPSLLDQRDAAPELYPQLAIGVDVRAEKIQIENLAKLLPSIRKRIPASELLYIDCGRDVLIARFGETRRRHPLSDGTVSLAESFAREQELLIPLAEKADWEIDTTALSVHDLRSMIRNRYTCDNRSAIEKSEPVILCHSFGFKHGPVNNTDYIFDLRCLPNPYWDASLRKLSGNNPIVLDWFSKQDDFVEMQNDIQQFLNKWLPKFVANNRSYITIGFGCTGGRHRSVAMAETIAQHLQQQWSQVIFRHRDIEHI